MSCPEWRVLALGEKLHHGNGNAHLGHVRHRQPDAVPDLHHDPFFHHQIYQFSLAGELRAQMHFAHNTPWGLQIFVEAARESWPVLNWPRQPAKPIAHKYTLTRSE